MQRNPGIWIAAAVGLAVLVVAISVPRSPRPEPVPVVGPGPVSSSSPPPAPAVPAAPKATAPSRTTGVAVKDTVPEMAPVAGKETSPGAIVPAAPDRALISRDVAVQALDNVQFALRDFRSALGANPIGNNAEITKALMGNNVKQAKVGTPEGSQISADGELCDPWGTPYFFHQMSAQEMEVRSAGPDRVMWTKDDVEM